MQGAICNDSPINQLTNSQNIESQKVLVLAKRTISSHPSLFITTNTQPLQMEHTRSTMKPKEEETELRMSDEESQSVSADDAEGTTSGTIAGFETRLVRYSKLLFILSVVAAALAVGCITFLVLRKGEVDAYVDHVSYLSIYLYLFVLIFSVLHCQLNEPLFPLLPCVVLSSKKRNRTS